MTSSAADSSRSSSTGTIPKVRLPWRANADRHDLRQEDRGLVPCEDDGLDGGTRRRFLQTTQPSYVGNVHRSSSISSDPMGTLTRLRASDPESGLGNGPFSAHLLDGSFRQQHRVGPPCPQRGGRAGASGFETFGNSAWGYSSEQNASRRSLEPWVGRSETNSSCNVDIEQLKSRLAELQQMVVHLGKNPRNIPENQFADAGQMTANQVMLEMRAQLELQKELHLRRKELEELMEKDVLSRMSKNESWISQKNFPKTRTHHDRQGRSVGVGRNRHGPSDHSRGSGSDQLESKLDEILYEMRRLNSGIVDGGHHSRETNSQVKDVAGNQISVVAQEQQQQIQELCHMTNRTLDEMAELRNEIDSIKDSVAKLLSSTSNNAMENATGTEHTNGRTWPPSENDVMLNSTPRPEALPDWLQDRKGHPWVLSPAEMTPHDPSLPQAAATQATLNNQVLPGTRANNYWDNFRSFSHQNRLSGNPPTSRSLHLEQSAALVPIVPFTASNIAQVLPTVNAEQQPNQSQRDPLPAEEPTTSTAGGVSRAFVESTFGVSSPPRPKRKQKINREQNREVSSNTSTFASAARVFPMQHNGGTNAATEVRTDSHGSVVRSLTSAIYQELDKLLAEHREQPDHLCQIFEGLQSIDNRLVTPQRGTSIWDPIRQDVLNAATSTADVVQRDGANRLSASRNDDARFGGESHDTRCPVDPCDEEIALATSNALTSRGESCGDGREVIATSTDQVRSYLGSTNQHFHNSEQPLRPNNGGGQEAVTSNIHDARTNLDPHSVGDTRETPLEAIGAHAMLFPEVTDTSPATPPNMFACQRDGSVAQSVPKPDLSSSWPEVGLDRVPTRLSAAQLERQMRDEDANMHQLVDEVLDSSSSSDDREPLDDTDEDISFQGQRVPVVNTRGD